MPTKTGQNATLYTGKDDTITFTEVDTEDLSAFNELTYAFADSESRGSKFTKTKSGGGITVSGSSNEDADVSVDGSDTASLTTPAVYYHELVTEDSSGNEQVAATGFVTLLPAQTDN